MFKAWAEILRLRSGYEEVPNAYAHIFDEWAASNCVSSSNSVAPMTNEAHRARIMDELRADELKRGRSSRM